MTQETEGKFPPTVLAMVRDRLIADGYDGLYCDNCGCDIAHLAPCDSIGEDCRAGFKVPCDCGECNWHIRGERPFLAALEGNTSVGEIISRLAELARRLAEDFASERQRSEALQARVKELEAARVPIPSSAPSESEASGVDLCYRAFKRQEGELWKDLCRRTGQQNCGDCEDFNCGDNLRRRLAQRESGNPIVCVQSDEALLSPAEHDKAELDKYARRPGETTSQLCRRTQIQNCHECEDFTCGDNMSPQKPKSVVP